jgi:hypothetical protein
VARSPRNVWPVCAKLRDERATYKTQPFLSRFACFFSFAVFSGAFLVSFLEFCVLAMVIPGLRFRDECGGVPRSPERMHLIYLLRRIHFCFRSAQFTARPFHPHQSKKFGCI